MIVNDIYGNPYEIKDIKSFKNHIVEFHTLNGLPDNSLHEENGFYSVSYTHLRAHET